MAIDTIKSSAVLDGAIATADIADNAVTLMIRNKRDIRLSHVHTFSLQWCTTKKNEIRVHLMRPGGR